MSLETSRAVLPEEVSCGFLIDVGLTHTPGTPPLLSNALHREENSQKWRTSLAMERRIQQSQKSSVVSSTLGDKAVLHKEVRC